jgi:hypothetical protein
VFGLQIQHGADFNAGKPEQTSWYFTRFNKLDQVQFLISLNVDPHYISDIWHTSSLDEAIDNKDQAMTQELVNAGAKNQVICKHSGWFDEMAA